MTHAHDDIRVGTLCLPFIGNGWLMPWGEVVSNPLKAQRLAEEYRERQEADEIRWTPSIHMPRWASRLTLEITGVRVERLDKISEEDAVAEGMQGVICRSCKGDPDYSTTQYDPDTLAAVDEIQCQSCSSNRSKFFSLWDSIYGEGNHCMGDWVWVIEFKVAPNVPANSTGSDLR
ncbi:DUF1317 family protein [Enterobacter ludwigii]